jgi:AraC-like DNA-binding protein
MLRSFSGAAVRRVVDRSHASVPEHAHEWPLLSIFVMGGYASHTELGNTEIGGPSVILYRAGTFHRNDVGPDGFEQIEIEFDPAWLGAALPSAPLSRWLGGGAGASARELARLCSEATEDSLRVALQRFIVSAKSECDSSPAWVGAIAKRLRENPTLSVAKLAAEATRHPSWAGTAYHRAMGERLQETASRFRVERAARMLRETDRPFAAVAVDAGFCDQSHMIRSFRRVLGRAPSEVRKDRLHFRASAVRSSA